jgi:hypothetical protein
MAEYINTKEFTFLNCGKSVSSREIVAWNIRKNPQTG